MKEEVYSAVNKPKKRHRVNMPILNAIKNESLLCFRYYSKYLYVCII